MPMNQRILITVGAAVGILILLIVVVIVVTHQTAGFLPGISQNCPANVSKCKGYSEYKELFHMESGKCFRKGEEPEGICERNMAILPVSNCAIQGRCECAYDRHERLLIYHPETLRCYFVYQQGFCETGKWVALSPEGKGVCERDTCQAEKVKDPGSPDEWVPFKGRCFKLYSNLNEPDCTGVLRFWKGKVNPSCERPAVISTGGVGAVPSANCPPGSFQAVNGYCQPEIDFDFD